jgi:hypothetical protein
MITIDKERLNDPTYIDMLKGQLQTFYLVGLDSKGETKPDEKCLFVKSYFENERFLVDLININRLNKATYMTIILGTNLNYKLIG